MLNDQTPKQCEKAINKLFEKYGIENKITVEMVKKWIWNAMGPGMEAVNKYHKKCFQIFPEIEFDEFEAMLKEMEKVQKPFKKWIEKDALPKYKKYLEQMIKNKNIREDHYEVADIFFQRVLHVGFVDLEGIRPEFIREEFPYWWPTHVMQSKLKPAHVKKYLKELFKFIDIVY